MSKLIQFSAAIRKNYLLKRRNLMITLLELLLPLVVMFMLMFAFKKSRVVKLHERSYTDVKYSFPSDFSAALDTMTGKRECLYVHIV
jgi:hypothetical protein